MWPSKPLLETPIVVFYLQYYYIGGGVGTTVTQWLRCCAINRKVAGSIPAGVSGMVELEDVFLPYRSTDHNCTTDL